MTLEKYLDKKKTGKIRLGSNHGSGYFYCGTVEDLLNYREDYQDRVYERAKFLKAKAIANFEVCSRNEPTPLAFYRRNNDGTGEDYIKFVNQWLNEMRRKAKSVERRAEYVKNYIPLFDRDVEKTYDATAYDDDTTCVIIEGRETGAYWTIEEAEQAGFPMKFAENVSDEVEEQLDVAV